MTIGSLQLTPAPLAGPLRLEAGFSAFVVPGGRLRRELLIAIQGGLSDEGDPIAAALAGLRGGPSYQLSQAVEIVANALGLAAVDRGLAKETGALVGRPGGNGSLDSVLSDQLEAIARVAEALETREAEFQDLRADAVESVGDLEVSNMEWLRERQDAATHLQAYRDRARELKGRIAEIETGGTEASCPTCGRVLEEHVEHVIGFLRDEWESVVQDGKWWKRRHEQLDFKPETLQQLEGETLRIQAACEAMGEEVERTRAKHSELQEAYAHLMDASGITGGEPTLRGRALVALREELRAEAKDLLLTRTSRLLNRITGGSVLGVVEAEDGSPLFVGDSGGQALVSDEETAAFTIGLRLAAADLASRRGAPVATLVVGDAFARLQHDARIRTVMLLRSLLSRIPQVLLFCPGEVVGMVPETFDRVVEIREGEDDGKAVVRSVQTGVGRLSIH